MVTVYSHWTLKPLDAKANFVLYLGLYDNYKMTLGVCVWQEGPRLGEGEGLIK